MNNFWEKLKNKNEPIYVLAPMAGITDIAFREMCIKYGADVVYSEMASVNALKFKPEKTLKLLESIKSDKPYVVQLFGNDPEYFKNAIKIITNRDIGKQYKLKNYRTPDGIDINFGCPVSKIVKQKAGAELSKDLKLSRKIIKTVVENTDLPVSIKIRSNVGNVDALKFLGNISDLDVKAVIIHGRDIKQMHKGEVNTDIIKKARKYFKGVIIANGGVVDKNSSDELLQKSEADGVAIGQGAFGKPWIFTGIKDSEYKILSEKTIFEISLEHASLAEKYKGERGIIEMRKHLCWYVQGLPGAKKLREEFVRVSSLEEIKTIIKNQS